MDNIFIETYGCTLNKADSDFMIGLLKKCHRIVSTEKKADVVIVNTCTVKGATEEKIFSRLKELKKQKKNVIVTGCLAVNEKRIRSVLPLAPIVHPSNLKYIQQAVRDAITKKSTHYPFSESDVDKSQLPRMYTAPILRVPIADGCVGNCSFCQTKFARPKLISHPSSAIIDWICRGVKKGAKEIQLTAMDSGAYGLDIGSTLPELLDKITSIEAQFFVRLGMCNPEHARRYLNDLLRIFSSKKFYKFLHVPVQSGSDHVLNDMKRKHSVKDFIFVVNKFREKFRNITIATDIISGYPTETEEDHEKTKHLLEKIKPDIVNLSKFSPRPMTFAKTLSQLPTTIIKQRSKELSEIIKHIHNNRKFIGRTYAVLITEKQRTYSGRTYFYKQVVFPSLGTSELGRIIKAKIISATPTYLVGEPDM